MRINTKLLKETLELVRAGLAVEEIIDQSTSFVFTEGFVWTYNDRIMVSHPLDLDITGAVESDRFFALIKKIRVKEIDIVIEGEELQIRTKKSTAGIPLQKEILLPIKDASEQEDWHPLPKEFLDAVRLSIPFTSKDTSKPVLTTLNCDGSNVLASDGYQVSVYNLDAELPMPFLLPAKSAKFLIEHEVFEYHKEKSWIHFKDKRGVIFSCRTMIGTFPPVLDFLFDDGQEIIFPQKMEGMLERVGIFAKSDFLKDDTLEVQIESGKVIVKTEKDGGWMEEEAGTKYTGDEINFTVAPELLIGILKKQGKIFIKDAKVIFVAENFTVLIAINRKQ